MNESIILGNVTADSDASFSGVRTTLKRLDTDTVTICTIKEISGVWITIAPDAELPQGALVQIEFNGCMGLGEVLQLTKQHCRIQLKHIVRSEDIGRFWNNSDQEVP
ncbi:MAG TPA: hypothetical protein PLA43_21290 [Bryobacteraceae bacterium]|nr:hypothetical protein [Bryobacteraceae bacterium]HPU74495.1 hypothetical protein [Bryobacteraceae bacterium]